MWKAELTKPVEKRDGNVIATVKFSSDTGESFTQEVPGFDLTPDTLAAFCQRLVVLRETRDASFVAFAGVQVGPIALPRDKP